mgnify:CR=1 FL=1
MMNFYESLGFLVFGSRMRRLSESFLLELNKVYHNLDLDFEASWFPMFFLVSNQHPVSLNDIARQLEISHSAVSQLASVLKKKGLITSVKSQIDERKQLLALSKAGLTLKIELAPVWLAITETMQSLFAENQESASLLAAISVFEARLQSGNLNKLIQERYRQNRLVTTFNKLI